ncbi:flavonoid 3',5'-hydroxylase-like [Carya illinoinensis]|uniref:flavonoid 3',5'-hydroxylase-like n=1 Tax=Carya illinoinensis TaxID=32201 RepID=UPI001C71A64C|nr:flavonoid 3',5'-hydroxylase-like [Carya illinoinensis]
MGESSRMLVLPEAPAASSTAAVMGAASILEPLRAIKSLAKAKEEGTAKTGQKDFLQVLLELRGQDDVAPSMSITQIKAMVFLDIVIAATDTTTTMLEWVMAMLLKHPKIMRKTFRLHPPGPFLLLRTPSEFKLERFLNNAYDRFDYSGNNFKYLPFGSGRRICTGLALRERTLKYILASFLHSYEWKLPQGSEIEFSDTFGVITKKKNPTIAILTPRLSKSELYTK